MKTSKGSGILVFALIALLIVSCAPASTITKPTIASPTSKPSAVAPTFTLEPTASPSFELECKIVKMDSNQPLSGNEYGLTEVQVETGNMVIDRLQVNIISESGEFNSQQSVNTDINAFGELQVKIEDERTYSNSNNTYNIIGSLYYGISDVTTMLGYQIEVSADNSGAETQNCNYP